MRTKKYTDEQQKWFKRLYNKVAMKLKRGTTQKFTKVEDAMFNYIDSLESAAQLKEEIVERFYTK